MSGDLSMLVITPLGSTLAAGGAVSVSVAFKPGSPVAQVLSIDADIAASQSLQVSGNYGAQIQVPADIDFGNVPVGVSSPTVFIPVPPYVGIWPGAGLIFFGGDSGFEKSGVTPTLQSGGMGWTLYVRGSVPGPLQTTLKFISISGSTVCAPDTFTARAMIVTQ